VTALPFPKIPAWRGEADPLQQCAHVVALEKIDGANIRIGVPAGATRSGALVIGGRTLMEDHPDFQQAGVVQIIRDDAALCQRLLEAGAWARGALTLYAEACGARIQRMGFVYGTRTHLVLFAARVEGAWVGHSRSLVRPGWRRSLPTLTQLAERAGLPLAPLLYAGPPGAGDFDALLERPSRHSRDVGFDRPGVDTTHEGIVIWSDPVLLDPWGEPLVAKYKQPRRREYRPPAIDDGLEGFARRATPPERLAHARQFLRERGRWRGTDEDHPALIRRVIQDVAREVPEYADQLRRHGKRAARAALEAAIREQLDAPDEP